MKYCKKLIHENGYKVAPLAGAWIEIIPAALPPQKERVAPLAGAWIEIADDIYGGMLSRSHPSRVRGLKFSAPLEIYV